MIPYIGTMLAPSATIIEPTKAERVVFLWEGNKFEAVIADDYACFRSYGMIRWVRLTDVSQAVSRGFSKTLNTAISNCRGITQVAADALPYFL